MGVLRKEFLLKYAFELDIYLFSCRSGKIQSKPFRSGDSGGDAGELCGPTPGS